MLACPRRKLTRDLTHRHTFKFHPSLDGLFSDTTSPELPGRVSLLVCSATQNLLMPVVVESCKEYSGGSPDDRHSAKCRASKLHSQDSLRSEAFRWGQPEGVPVAGPTELSPSVHLHRDVVRVWRVTSAWRVRRRGTARGRSRGRALLFICLYLHLRVNVFACDGPKTDRAYTPTLPPTHR